MFAGLRVKAVQQHGVCSAVLSLQFEFWIIHDDVAVVSDSKLFAYLQNNLCACAWRRHKPSSPDRSPRAGMPC